MPDAEKTKSIRVSIMGREYGLRVQEDDEAHTRRMAASVDQRMQKFKEAHPEQAELTTAVMTALSLAEELFLQRDEYEDGTAALSGELEALVDELDEIVPATDTSEKHP